MLLLYSPSWGSYRSRMETLLMQAELSHLLSFDKLIDGLKKRIDAAFHGTNQSILLVIPTQTVGIVYGILLK